MLPSVSQRVDWEVELGVVIGLPVYRATPEEAAAAIAGYTVINDVSMRDWQRRTLQWLARQDVRALDTGRALPRHRRRRWRRGRPRGQVRGRRRDHAAVADLGPAVQAGRDCRLCEPGDHLEAGRPFRQRNAGCGGGDARKPAVDLQAGNVLRTWVEGLGECLNHCVAEKADLNA